EVRRVQAAAAAEGEIRAVVEARLEAVAPAGGETQPGAVAGIEKAEQTVRARILVLLLEIEIQPVLVAQRRVEADADVAAGARVRDHEAVVLHDAGVAGGREILQQPRRSAVEARRGNRVVG